MCHHPTWNNVRGVNGVSSQTLNFFMLSVIYPHGSRSVHEESTLNSYQKLLYELYRNGTLDLGPGGVFGFLTRVIMTSSEEEGIGSVSEVCDLRSEDSGGYGEEIGKTLVHFGILLDWFYFHYSTSMNVTPILNVSYVCSENYTMMFCHVFIRLYDNYPFHSLPRCQNLHPDSTDS